MFYRLHCYSINNWKNYQKIKNKNDGFVVALCHDYCISWKLVYYREVHIILDWLYIYIFFYIFFSSSISNCFYFLFLQCILVVLADSNCPGAPQLQGPHKLQPCVNWFVLISLKYNTHWHNKGLMVGPASVPDPEALF